MSAYKSDFTLIDTKLIAKDIYRLILNGDVSHIKSPGEFVNIDLPGFFLRRPISVGDVNRIEGTLTLFVKVLGEGTVALTNMDKGTKLDILTGLGNGFNTDKAGNKPLIIGGGIGLAPLYYLAKCLKEKYKDIDISVIIGVNSKEELYLNDELKDLGLNTYITSADGSIGEKGFVTDILDRFKPSYFYACGPLPMLKAISEKIDIDGELSLEGRFGCGLGICMGCSIHTKRGSRRVCKDGPVFPKDEIIW